MSTGFTGKRNNEILEAAYDDATQTLRVKEITTLPNGSEISPSYTAEGHLEVALHSPRLPFGSIHTESLYPLFQTDGVYGLDSGPTGGEIATTSGSGTATTSDSMFTVSTGTTIYSQGVIQTRNRLRYRPGQG